MATGFVEKYARSQLPISLRNCVSQLIDIYVGEETVRFRFVTAASVKHLFALCTKHYKRKNYANLNRDNGLSRVQLFKYITE